MDIKDKKVIVTGGCSGLGKEFSLFLLEKGAFVIPTTRNSHMALEFMDCIPKLYKEQCVPEVLSYDTEEDIDKFIDIVKNKYNNIYALINCAVCRSKIKDKLDISLNNWKHHYNVNVFGTTYLTVNIAKKLIVQNGSILSISSFYSINIPDNRIYDDKTIPTSLIYASSKAALNYITQYLAVEYAEKNIRVNAILAGGVENPLRQSEFFKEQYSYRTPMKRLAKIDEFNDAILFFLSSDNTYCTGQLLSIDGGWMLF